MSNLKMTHYMVLILTTFALLSPGAARAQFKQGDVWVLGYDYNGHTPEVEGNILDFSSGQLQIFPMETAFSIYLTNSNISDGNGNLLFYTNGAKLANGEHEVLIDTLCPGDKYEQNSFFGYPMVDGIILFPILSLDDSYIILFLDYNTEPNDSTINYFSYLKYARFNSNVDNSAILLNDNIILNNRLVTTGISLVKSEDHMSWWSLVWDRNDFSYYSIKYSEEHPLIFKKNHFEIPSSIYHFLQVTAFSPLGNKYVRFDPFHLCALFDFNRERGELSIFKSWIVDEGKNGVGGVSFSPSGRFLYVSNGNKLFQYDTESQDIPGSEVLIAEWDQYLWQGATTRFNVHKNTPDCRIFISTTGSTPFLHVIHHPDEKGAACGFEMRGIELPWPHDRGLPNIPNYRLGTPEENYCDSIKVNTNELIRGWLPAISPNPVSDQLRIVWPQSVDMQVVRIMDIQGRTVHQERPSGVSKELTVMASQWYSGTYIIELIARDGSRVVRKVVKQ